MGTLYLWVKNTHCDWLRCTEAKLDYVWTLIGGRRSLKILGVFELFARHSHKYLRRTYYIRTELWRHFFRHHGYWPEHHVRIFHNSS